MDLRTENTEVALPLSAAWTYQLHTEKPAITLSKREIEVLALIAEGFNTIQIAQQMFRSEDTIESHRRNIINKLKVNNACQAVAYAIRNGLIP
jgi:DNA-binding NarL/FixJ family response regulator